MRMSSLRRLIRAGGPWSGRDCAIRPACVAAASISPSSQTANALTFSTPAPTTPAPASASASASASAIAIATASASAVVTSTLPSSSSRLLQCNPIINQRLHYSTQNPNNITMASATSFYDFKPLDSKSHLACSPPLFPLLPPAKLPTSGAV